MRTVTRKSIYAVFLGTMLAMSIQSKPVNHLGCSPNGSLCLVLKKTGEQPPLLELVDTTTSKTISSATLEASPINELKPVWSNRNDAVAVAVDYSTTNSKPIGFLRLPDGQFKLLEFSATARGNLGKFGESDDHWKQIKNFPVAWDTMTNTYNYRFVDVKTQVWDKTGQRFTVVESVGITTGGLIAGR